MKSFWEVGRCSQEGRDPTYTAASSRRPDHGAFRTGRGINVVRVLRLLVDTCVWLDTAKDTSGKVTGLLDRQRPFVASREAEPPLKTLVSSRAPSRVKEANFEAQRAR